MKINKNKRYLEFIFIILLLAFFVIVSCKEISEKQDRHIDEYLSYMLANDTGSGLTLNIKNTNAKQEMNAYLTVNEKNTPFNYKNVWENQSMDTHPPLFYAVLHTVCSFFPNVFSTWFACGINVFFMCLSIIILYMLCKAITQRIGISFVITFGVALNPAIIENVTFARMYTMATFWCVLLMYIVFKYIGCMTNRAYLLLSIVVALGTLTHYYFIFFAVFVIGVVLLNELIGKRLKNIFKLGLSLLTSVVATIAVFPAIIKHLFSGNRGEENLVNLFNFSDYIAKLKGYFNIINKDAFYSLIIVLLFVAIFGLIYLCNKKKEYIWKMIVLTIPSLMYFLLVVKAASYVADRYIVMSYPMIILGVYVGIYYCIDFLISFFEKKGIKYNLAYSNVLILALITCLLTLKGYKNYNWDYSSKAYKNTIAPLTEDLSNNDCMYIYISGWKVWSSYVELVKYPNITFENYSDGISINAEEYNNDELIVYVERDISGEALEDLMNILQQYESVELLYDNYSYNNVYILKK